MDGGDKMNTVSMKVNVPSSREIMGAKNGGKNAETPANYEQGLSGGELAAIDGADCVELLDAMCCQTS